MNDNDVLLIEKFINGETSDEENNTINQRLTQDGEFAERLSTYKSMINALILNNKNRNELKALQQEVQQEKKKSGSGQWLRMAMAAAAVVLLLIVAKFFINLTPPSEQLYQEYYTPLAMQGVSRNANNNTVEKSTAIELYSSGRYEEAIPVIQGLLEEGSVSDKWHVYLANAYMMTDNLTLAQQALQSALVSDDPFIYQHALWYASLLDVKMKNLANAKDKLQKIKKLQGPYRQNAQMLLDQLSR